MKLRAALLGLAVATGICLGVATSQATVSNVTVDLSESSPYAYVTGTTVYYSAHSGSFTVTADGDSDNGGVTDVDFPDVFGSGTSNDNSAPFQRTYSFTSGDMDGGTEHVTVNDLDGGIDGDFTVTRDPTAPTGQSVSLSGGPGYSTLSVPLILGNGTDGGAGIDSASGVVERDSATLTAGTCGAFSGTWSTVALVGGADTSVATGNCYRYRYTISDNVGNDSGASTPSAYAVVDTSAPTIANTAPTEGAGAGDQFWVSSTSTMWYRPAGAGSFTLNADASAGSSGVAQVTFPNISATTGWAGSNGGADTSSPYSSPVAYTWTSGAVAPGAKTVVATTGGGGTASATVTISADSTAPTGQTIALSSGPWYSSSVSLAIGQGTDAGAGVDSTRGVVERASAPLTNGVCGTFGTYAAVTLSSSADTTVTSGNCYRYQYKASDNVGNVSTASTASADAKIDATAPTVPTLRITGLSNAAVSGNVVYYRPTGTGSFTITAASSDTESGIASYSFPSVSGFTTTGSGPSRTYSYSNAGTAPSSPQSVTARNGAGLNSSAATFRLVADGTAPTLTVKCNGKPCSSALYRKAVTVTASASDGSGSGLDTIRYTLNGGTPTADSGFEYERSFSVRKLTRLRMRAYDKAGNASAPVVLTIKSAADRLFFAAPLRLTVKSGARFLFAKVTSTRRAIASATMSGPGLKHAQRWRFILSAGTSIVQFRLPAGLPKSGRYTVVWVVRAGTQKASKTTRVTLGSP